MKKPTRWSRYAMLKRSYRGSRNGRKPLYLFVFPEDRLGGWLCDGNDTRGMAMLERQGASQQFGTRPR